MNVAASPISFGNILDVEESQTKNLLRGLLNCEEANVLPTFNHLRNVTSAKDIEQVSRLILCSPLFSHLKLLEDFPVEPPRPIRRNRPNEQTLYNELVFQGIRIEKNSAKLVAALSDLRFLNDCLLAGDAPLSLEAMRCFIGSYGYSLVVLSKIAYMRAKFAQDEDVQAFCNDELDKYGARRRSAVTLAAMDMMGTSYEYLALRRNLLEFAYSKNTGLYTRDILAWQFRPIRFTQIDIASQLLSHGQASALDALIFICIHRYNVDILGRLGLGDTIDQYLSANLREEWSCLAATNCEADAGLPAHDEPEFNDFHFYRRSLAWIECRSISQFRNAVDPLYLESSAKNRITNQPAVDFLKDYFAAVTRLEDIVTEPRTSSISLNCYDNDRAGTFQRTLAFIYLMRTGVRASDISSAQLLCLMNWTRDIALIATTDELRAFFNNPVADKLEHYIATAVIADSSSLNTDQHRYRRALQKIVLETFGGEIIQFADYLRARAKHVSRHLFDTCTEAVLVQLFSLLPKPEMVFETRAALLDWYADAFDEPAAKERAKTLRLDVRLRQVRGEIDDTRIYVDTLRFGQWLQDKTQDELSAVLQGDPPDDAMIHSFKTLSDFAEVRTPQGRLARVLQAAFLEFCSNKRYGVDSYLGRRIRHGTLKGNMFTPIPPILCKSKYRELLSNKHAKQFLDEWLLQYEAAITHWGQEVFQVRAKQKQKGAITPDVAGQDKIEITKMALRDIRNIFAEEKSLATANQAITEWCWRLVEKDLVSIRMMIDSARIHWGVISRSDFLEHVPSELQGLGAELCREVNQLTDEKFRLLGRWFTKPTNLAPSALLSLLLDAVIAEVKEHFPDFSPKVSRNGLSDIELFGMHYHHVYDYLYVAIYNAAKHGNRRGVLGLTVELSDGTHNMRRLEIAISSQTAVGESVQSARASIEAELCKSIEDAMVVEGRSGIRKLRQLSSDVREIEDIYPSYGTDTVQLHCVMNLPVS